MKPVIACLGCSRPLHGLTAKNGFVKCLRCRNREKRTSRNRDDIELGMYVGQCVAIAVTTAPGEA